MEGREKKKGRKILRETDQKMSVGKWTNDTRVKQMSKPRLKHTEI